MAADLDIIFSRLHPKLKEKREIFTLIQDSYKGGETYTKGKNLFRYSRETSFDYANRLKRSVYLNHLQPLADILAGLLFVETPTRVIPENLKFIEDKCSPTLSLNSFMQTLSIQSLMFTCGVLVDSPRFDALEIKTEKDRKDKKINPYAVLYYPHLIRDFYFNEQNELEWLLLDNSYYDNKDPFKVGYTVQKMTLWRKDTITDYKKNEKGEIEATEIKNELGVIPFIFCNFRDIEEDKIADTPFEDIALIDRTIYNYQSLFDEMLYAGTIKVFFFPLGENQSEIPKGIVENGLGNLTAVPFDGSLSQKPFFDGPSLSETTPFLACKDMLVKEIQSKAGLDKDEEKSFAQSGIAKALEYRKCQSLLSIGASQMEKIEAEIFRFFSLWLGLGETEVSISYDKNFTPEDIDATVTRLNSLFDAPFASLRKQAAMELAKTAFRELTKKDMDELINKIQNESEETVSDTMNKFLSNKQA